MMPMAQKRKHSPSEEDGHSKPIFQSTTVEDRSSTFTSYFSPTLTPKELQSLPEIKSASHKILAWRRESAQQSLTPGRAQYTADHDDDGEKYGGRAVQRVLERMNVVGVCVVARWYGGVMLGQVRFSHMEKCAEEAVQEWKHAEAAQKAKKQKVMNDETERQSLLKVLAQRDQSILVLRALALEKETAVKKVILAGVDDLQAKRNGEQEDPRADVQKAQEPSSSASPSVKTNYSTVPLERLRVLEKGRDATLSFLLKRINKAEADLAAIDNQDPW